MASEVYQLKANGKDITLGKGPNADDAFVSFNDLVNANFTIAGISGTSSIPSAGITKLYEYCIPWASSGGSDVTVLKDIAQRKFGPILLSTYTEALNNQITTNQTNGSTYLEYKTDYAGAFGVIDGNSFSSDPTVTTLNSLL